MKPDGTNRVITATLNDLLANKAPDTSPTHIAEHTTLKSPSHYQYYTQSSHGRKAIDILNKKRERPAHYDGSPSYFPKTKALSSKKYTETPPKSSKVAKPDRKTGDSGEFMKKTSDDEIDNGSEDQSPAVSP